MGRLQRSGYELSQRRAVALAASCFLLAFGAMAARADAFVYWADVNSIGRANLDGRGVAPGFMTGLSAFGLAVDGSHIYFANADANSIGRADLDGSHVEAQFIPGAGDPQAVAVDGSHIYWANRGTTGNPGSIGRADLDGSVVQTQFIGGLDFPSSVAVDGSHVYWTEPISRHTIGRANLDGSQVNERFIAGTSCGSFNGCPAGLAVDGAHVYWANDNSSPGSIWRASIDGAHPGSFIRDAHVPVAVAVDSSHVYWTSGGTVGGPAASVGEASIDGSAVNGSLVAGLDSPGAIAVDAGLPVPTMATVATASVRSGGQISDAAVLSGGDNPTGSVTFYLSGPNDPLCEAPVAESTVPLVGGVATATPVAETTTGVYHWIASYSGDAHNAPVGGQCGDTAEASTVLAVPTLSTTATQSSPLGGRITDLATVAGGDTPTGTVTFQLLGPGDSTCQSVLSSTSAPVIGGIATAPPATASAPGVYHWIASYSGDQDNAPVAGHCGDPGESSSVNGAAASLSTFASSATLPATISDSATLSGASNPTGTISFSLYAPSDPGCTGAPVFSASRSVSGNGSYASGSFAPPIPSAFQIDHYHWVASYSGDQTNPTIPGQCGELGETSTVVRRNSPAIRTRATASATVGQAISDIAALTGGFPASGNITFDLYAVNPFTHACTAKLLASSTVAVTGNVARSAPFTPTAPGLYQWIARYGGDANNNPESGQCTDAGETSKVTQPTILVYDGPTEGTIGRPVALAARLFTGDGGLPSESVTIGFGADACTATTDATGAASCQVSPHDPLAGSPYRITARFAGTQFLRGSVDTSQSYTLAGPGSGPPAVPQLRLAIDSSRAKVTRGRTKLRLACAGPRGAVCRGTLTLSVRVRQRVRHRRSKFRLINVRLGRAAFAVPAGRTDAVALGLSRSALRLLAHSRKHRIAATAQAADRNTAPATVRRVVVLVR